jgi:hypothetical protein
MPARAAPSVLFFSAALLCAATTAFAANARTSSFRLIDIQPAEGGAKVALQYDNEWPQPWQNESYCRVRLWAYLGDPTGRPLLGCWTDDEGYSRAEGGINLGTRRMPGSGTLELKLDYAALGLRAGEMLYISGHWRDHGHEWGEPYGRPAGGLRLPEPLAAGAQKNGLLRGPAQRPARWLPLPAPGLRTLFDRGMGRARTGAQLAPHRR